MPSDLAGVVLAAGAGTRLRPLTYVRPKALATVATRPLLDWALDRVAPYAAQVAVNVHHHADQLLAALDGRPVHVSHEEEQALGTAGALGNLRDWLDGRPVLVTNADAWYPQPAARSVLDDLVAGWDGERPRLLCVAAPEGTADFGDLRYIGTALLPWSSVRDLPAEPAGLYEVSWRQLFDDGGLDLVRTDLEAIDCGTPRDYLTANLAATAGDSAVEPGARVEGEVVRSVVWAGETVAAGERLVEAVRGAGVTLQPYAEQVRAGE
jgi:NDP-sugar pyrophosphorylase family protein